MAEPSAIEWDDEKSVSLQAPHPSAIQWDDAKAQELAPSAMAALGRGAVQGATLGFSDEIKGATNAAAQKNVSERLGLKSPDAPYADLYHKARDAERAENAAAAAAHPGAYSAGSTAGALAPGLLVPGSAFATLPRAVGTGVALGALQGAGNSEADTAGGLALDAGVGGAAGGVGGAIGYGGQKLIGSAATAIGDKLRGAESKLATQLGDKASAAAQKTANSALGGLGKATSQGSSDLKLLEMLRAQGVSPELEQRIADAISGPEAAALRESLGANAVERLPDQLGRIATARALSETTAAAVPAAQALGATPDYAAQMLKQRAIEQAKRYAIPIAGGVAGAVLGPDDHRGASALAGFGLGAAAGRGISPAVNAVVKNLAFAPEARRLASGAAASAFERIATATRTNPAALGRFAPVLTEAMHDGEQSFAARVYALAQTDPDFEALHQKLAEAK